MMENPKEENYKATEEMLLKLTVTLALAWS